MRSRAPRPARILTVCCITDMHINDMHISVIFRGGQAFFDPFGVKINVYTGATIRPNFFRFILSY
jgi:hypothetical protein